MSIDLIPLLEQNEEAKPSWRQFDDFIKLLETEICRVYQLPEWVLCRPYCVALDRPRPRELVHQPKPAFWQNWSAAIRVVIVHEKIRELYRQQFSNQLIPSNDPRNMRWWGLIWGSGR